MNKKYKFILTIIVAILAIVVSLFLFTSCGGNDGGDASGSSDCTFHWDDNEDGQCDTCGFVFPAVDDTNPSETTETSSNDVVKAFNDFLTSSIDLSAFMEGRYVVSDVWFSHKPIEDEEQIENPRVEEILISNNVAHVRYTNPIGDNEISDEYFVLNAEGYYVIQQGRENESYIFKSIYVPDLSQLTIEAEDVSYDYDSGLYSISSDWTRDFLFHLLTKTNVLDNLLERSYDGPAITQLLGNTNFDFQVGIDVETKQINCMKVKSYFNRNGKQSEVFEFSFDTTEEGYSIYMHEVFGINRESQLDIIKETDVIWTLEYEQTTYNIVGGVAGTKSWSFSAQPSKDETVILQPSTEETMAICERLLKNYDGIVSQTEEAFVLDEMGKNCSEVYAYDATNRCYLKFIFNDEEQAYFFDSIEIYVDQQAVCMVQLPKSGKYMTFLSHGTNDDWRNEIVSKYSGLFYGLQMNASGCSHVIVYDDEYEVYVLFIRVGNAYQMIDYDVPGDSLFACEGTVDLPNRTIALTLHSDNEQLMDALLNTQFIVTGNSASPCYSVAVENDLGEGYLIFRVENNTARFLCIQPNAYGMCTGVLYLKTNTLKVLYHENH